MAAELLTHAHYAWLVVASLLAGVMNAMAGGGSFLSFPAMLAMGVAPVQANATNTVAIWPGQLTSIFALRGDLRRDLLPAVSACAIVGGVGGAMLLLHTRQTTFLRVLPWMLLLATVLFGVSGHISKWMQRRTQHSTSGRTISTPILMGLLLPVCVYIGYFGAGAGFLIMAVLALLGVEEMHELNSMKILAACLANLCAVITFIANGAVVWHYCLIAMVFAAGGGYVGARYARRLNPAVLRGVVVATGCGVAGWFFWIQRHGV